MEKIESSTDEHHKSIVESIANNNYKFTERTDNLKNICPVHYFSAIKRTSYSESMLLGTKYVNKHTSETLPEKYSLKHLIEDIYNQGSMGACVAHSATQAIRLINNYNYSSKWMISRLWSGSPSFRPSRLYIYYNSRVLDNDIFLDAGTTNMTACLAIEEFKACDESIWDYQRYNLTKRPPHDAYTNAGRFKTFTYSNVMTVESIKDAIFNKHPVMVGVLVYGNFISAGTGGRMGNISMPTNLDKSNIMGGHSILIVGYDDTTKTFVFVNHWGENWGDKGFGTLPYELMNKYAADFYAIESFL